MPEQTEVKKSSGCMNWFCPLMFLPHRRLTGKTTPRSSVEDDDDDDDETDHEMKTTSTPARLPDRSRTVLPPAGAASTNPPPSGDLIETFDLLYTAPTFISPGRGWSHPTTAATRRPGGVGAGGGGGGGGGGYLYGLVVDGPSSNPVDQQRLRTWYPSGRLLSDPGSTLGLSLLDAVPPTPADLARRHQRRAATLPVGVAGGGGVGSWLESDDGGDDDEWLSRFDDDAFAHYKEPKKVRQDTYSLPHCTCPGCADLQPGSSGPYRHPRSLAPAMRGDDVYYNGAASSVRGRGPSNYRPTPATHRPPMTVQLSAQPGLEDHPPPLHKSARRRTGDPVPYDVVPRPVPIAVGDQSQPDPSASNYSVPMRFNDTDDDDEDMCNDGGAIYGNGDWSRHRRVQRPSKRRGNGVPPAGGPRPRPPRRPVPAPGDGPIHRLIQLRQVPTAVDDATEAADGVDDGTSGVLETRRGPATDYLLRWNVDGEAGVDLDRLGRRMTSSRRRGSLCDLMDDRAIYVNTFDLLAACQSTPETEIRDVQLVRQGATDAFPVATDGDEVESLRPEDVSERTSKVDGTEPLPAHNDVDDSTRLQDDQRGTTLTTKRNQADDTPATPPPPPSDVRSLRASLPPPPPPPMTPPYLIPLSDAQLLMMSPPPQSDPTGMVRRLTAYTDPPTAGRGRGTGQQRSVQSRLGTGHRFYDRRCLAGSTATCNVAGAALGGGLDASRRRRYPRRFASSLPPEGAIGGAESFRPIFEGVTCGGSCNNVSGVRPRSAVALSGSQRLDRVTS